MGKRRQKRDRVSKDMIVKIVKYEPLYDLRIAIAGQIPSRYFALRNPSLHEDPLFIINNQWHRRLTALG